MAAGLALLAQDSPHRGRKYKAPPPVSRIEVTILRDSDSKPVENAAVVFTLEQGEKGNMELKTNEDGKAVIDVLPTGSKVVMQVIAKGYKTYGGEYTIDKSALAIGVRLRRPGQQYSIYEEHGKDAQGAGPDAGTSPGAGPDKSQDKSQDKATNPPGDAGDGGKKDASPAPAKDPASPAPQP